MIPQQWPLMDHVPKNWTLPLSTMFDPFNLVTMHGLLPFKILKFKLSILFQNMMNVVYFNSQVGTWASFSGDCSPIGLLS